MKEQTNIIGNYLRAKREAAGKLQREVAKHARISESTPRNGYPVTTDPHGDQPGRFGFDTAELHLHLAEANLLLGDHAGARADAPQQHIPHRRPGWAAVVLVQAQREGRSGATTAMPPRSLTTSWTPSRLPPYARPSGYASATSTLFTTANPGGEAHELRERSTRCPASPQSTAPAANPTAGSASSNGD